MSGVVSPRLGTVPIGRVKDSVWLTRFSSRRLSDRTGMGSLVGEPRSGRKIWLNPWPCHVPVNADSGPKVGTCGAGGAGLLLPSVLGTSPNSKLPGRKRAGVRAPDSRLVSGMVQPRDTHPVLPMIVVQGCLGRETIGASPKCTVQV